MKKYALKFAMLILFAAMLSSCYSVRLVSIKGAPQPKADPSEEGNDKYRTVEMIELDTVIKAGAGNEFTFLIKQNKKCKSGKLHSVEYRNTFGGLLLSAITFGSRRKMKVKYVCMKETPRQRPR
jgi:hypothetical protein